MESELKINCVQYLKNYLDDQKKKTLKLLIINILRSWTSEFQIFQQVLLNTLKTSSLKHQQKSKSQSSNPNKILFLDIFIVSANKEAKYCRKTLSMFFNRDTRNKSIHYGSFRGMTQVSEWVSNKRSAGFAYQFPRFVSITARRVIIWR